MKYNFDELTERRNTNSVKWDFTPPDVLPLWVADMDFKICPEIQEALLQKTSQGIFGYEFLPLNFKSAIQKWLAKRHQLDVDEKFILPVPGILLGISAVLRTFLQPGDQFILQTPVYDHFFDFAENCDLTIVENPLIKNRDSYEIDFDDLKMKAADSKTKLLILCNPHNPVGKAWSRSDLEKIASICEEHQIIVISDEIHADLVFQPYIHTSFAAVARSFNVCAFTLLSPCKTFNLSGLSSGYLISENIQDLEKVQKILKMQETEWLNPFSAAALMAAYEHGEVWLDEMKTYLTENYKFLANFIESKIPLLQVGKMEATYLVWLDFSAFGLSSEEMGEKLINEAKLRLNPGTMYGKNGDGFMRINIACSRNLLKEALERLEKACHTMI